MSESESSLNTRGREWSSLTCTDGVGDPQPRSIIEIPTMNAHNDFISFLAVAQFYGIDFVSLVWNRGDGPVVKGGTSDIWQGNYDIRTDFIFKRSTLDDKFVLDSQHEERVFNALVSEISMLSHPLLRYHQNIVNLEGICWEIPQQGHKVWPVLILEKAQLGDLKSFMSSGEGKLTSLQDRLGLCGDIASALIAMHSNCRTMLLDFVNKKHYHSPNTDMSHGDIKPTNILVFKDGVGEIYAKIADFGYAGWSRSNRQDLLIRPPRSRPWDPPEYHHRGFSISETIKLDIYSFGLLCLWFLFYDRSHSVPAAANETVHWPFDNFDLLDTMKHEDTLGEFAGSLVNSVDSLSVNQRNNLEKFFSSALARESKQRILSLEDLTPLLGQNWQPGPSTTDADQITVEYSTVRFQLAFCYKIGFGVASDETCAQEWLERARCCTQDLDVEIDLAKSTINQSSYRNGMLQLLSLRGLLHEREVSTAYKEEDLPNVADEYKKEIEDMEKLFGRYHRSVIELRITRASVLKAAKKFKEAETIQIDLLKELSSEAATLQLSGVAGTESVFSRLFKRQQKTYEGPPSPRLQLDKPGHAEEPAALAKITKCLNQRVPETTQLLWDLGLNYIEQGRWLEAAWIILHVTANRMEYFGESHPSTLFSASNLAALYSELGEWSKAGRISFQICDIQIRTLGPNHADTLDTKLHIASAYRQQAHLDKAEEFAVQVLEARQKIYGNKSPSTAPSMRLLAWIYSDQGHFGRSEALNRTLLDISTNTQGPQHLSTLDAMMDLTVDLARQERWHEVKEITAQALDVRHKLLGPEHTDTLLCINNLAAVNYEEGNLSEAEMGFLRVTEAYTKVLGKNHPKTLDASMDLVYVYACQGRLKESEKLNIKIIELRKQLYGADHPKILDSMAHLATILSLQSRLEEAEGLLLQTLSLERHIRGERHPKHLSWRSRLAWIYLKQKRFKEGEEIILDILQPIEEIFGEAHSESLIARKRLAYLLDGQGRWQESNAFFLKVIEQRKKKFGEKDDLTLDITQSYAFSLWKQVLREEKQQGVQEKVRQNFPTHQWYITTDVIASHYAPSLNQPFLKKLDVLRPRLIHMIIQIRLEYFPSVEVFRQWPGFRIPMVKRAGAGDGPPRVPEGFYVLPVSNPDPRSRSISPLADDKDLTR
ncbi:MAG: hypothetical protein Q9214_003853 [Letrouitia sp. 1 TL-2023]